MIQTEARMDSGLKGERNKAQEKRTDTRYSASSFVSIVSYEKLARMKASMGIAIGD